MQTVVVQITNQKALRLLEELEELNVLKVLKTNILPNEKLAEKYAGKLSEEVAQKIQEHILDSRQEWDSSF